MTRKTRERYVHSTSFSNSFSKTSTAQVNQVERQYFCIASKKRTFTHFYKLLNVSSWYFAKLAKNSYKMPQFSFQWSARLFDVQEQNTYTICCALKNWNRMDLLFNRSASSIWSLCVCIVCCIFNQSKWQLSFQLLKSCQSLYCLLDKKKRSISHLGKKGRLIMIIKAKLDQPENSTKINNDICFARKRRSFQTAEFFLCHQW